MFIAFPFSFFNDESQAWGILNAGIITIFIGFLLFLFNKPKSTNIQKKEGYLKIEILKQNEISNKLIENLIDLIINLSKDYPKNIKLINKEVNPC